MGQIYNGDWFLLSLLCVKWVSIRGIYSSRKPQGVGGGIKIVYLGDSGKKISTSLKFSNF